MKNNYICFFLLEDGQERIVPAHQENIQKIAMRIMPVPYSVAIHHIKPHSNNADQNPDHQSLSRKNSHLPLNSPGLENASAVLEKYSFSFLSNFSKWLGMNVKMFLNIDLISRLLLCKKLSLVYHGESKIWQEILLDGSIIEL